MDRNKICWVILAGGKASRMGGDDKGLILVNGSPLIELVVNAIKPQTDLLYINANRNIEQYQSFTTVIEDELANFQGPLAGVQSCLTHIENDWIGFTPCDSPNIPSDLIQRLNQHIRSDVDIIVAHDGKHPQPVFSLWNRCALTKLNTFLENGDRKIKILLQQCTTVYADFSDIPETFINLNTPEELQEYGQIDE